MAGGSLHESFFTVAWPTGEFGAMGLEGAVKLGFKKEIDAQTDPAKKQALYDKLVKNAYDRGKATAAASFLEFDEVIDPKDSRQWIVNALESIPLHKNNHSRIIDSW